MKIALLLIPLLLTGCIADQSVRSTLVCMKCYELGCCEWWQIRPEPRSTEDAQ